MNPIKRLLIDLDTDRDLVAIDEVKPSEATLREARRRAEALLAEHGVSVGKGGPDEPNTIAERVYDLRLEPIYSHAAADLVKATVAWEAGTLRLLQSPMRSDLAVELLIDASRAAEFDRCVFLVSLKAGDDPIAILPGGSPVFCRVYPDDLSAGLDTRLACVPTDQLNSDQLASLRRSRQNLRDPGDLARYKELIERVERGG